MNNKNNISDCSNCYSEEVLIKYLNDELSVAESETLEAHLIECEMCSDVLDGLMLLDDPNQIFEEKEKINQQIDKIIYSKKRIFGLNQTAIRSIAAVALLLILSGTVLLINKIYNKTDFNSIAPISQTGNKKPISPNTVSDSNVQTAKVEVEEKAATGKNEIFTVKMPKQVIAQTQEEDKNLKDVEQEQKIFKESEKSETVFTPNTAVTGGTSSTKSESGYGGAMEETIGLLDFFNVDMDEIEVVSNYKTSNLEQIAMLEKKENRRSNKQKEDRAPGLANAPTTSLDSNFRDEVYREVKGEDLRIVDYSKGMDNNSFASEADQSVNVSADIESSSFAYEVEEEIEPIEFAVVEDKPVFPGGEEALLKFVRDNTVYPEVAKENSIQGKVYIQFVIDSTGKVTNVRVVKGVDPYLDQEATRVIKMLPNWTPGKQRGKTVSVTFVVPISFSLY